MKNLTSLMKQASQMQSKMEDMQKKMADMSVEGLSGGGMVKVTLNGKGDMRGIKIDPQLADPQEMEMLQDLIVAAVGDARRKMDEKVSEEMQKVTGGMSLPPGMKFPF